jgi:hypothetical protein
VNALLNSTNDRNIAIGADAGSRLTAGSGNIYIGNNEGPSLEIAAIRIGDSSTATAFIGGIRNAIASGGVPVLVNTLGQLHTINSSIKVKDHIADMDKVKDHIADMDDASRVLSQLRPVTFYYKSDKGSPRALQYGLVAEEVAKVAPELVAHDAKGEIQTVYYQFLAPMLLNEYQKQQRVIAAQAAEIAELRRDHEAQLARLSALEEQATRTAALLSRFELAVTPLTAAR